MEKKALFLAVFVASTLLGASRACDLVKVMACVSGAMGSGTMTNFENATEAMWENSCSTLKTAFACIKEATADCNSTEVNQMKATIEGVEGQLKQFCNEPFRCMIKLGDCVNREPELKTYLEAFTSVNTSYCPATANVIRCLRENIPKKCHVMKVVRDAVNGIGDLHDYCVEDSCPALKQCQATFYTSGPKDPGLDNKTCGLYETYASCAETALASCPELGPRRGQPAHSRVSGMIGQACSLMAQPDVIALYDCPAFTSCLTAFISDKNILSPQQLCRTLQGVIGCATKSVGSCPAVTSQARQAFIHDANMLALEAGYMGCGRPEVYAGGCTELLQCKIGLTVLTPSSPFAQQCSAIKTFQQCTGAAVKACNLTRPRQADDDKKPDLDRLAVITQKVCQAMDGKPVVTCKNYQECMANVNLPDTDSGLISPRAWCDVDAQTLECARLLKEECTVTDALKTNVENIYSELLDERCPNTFDFQTAEEPTGGSEALMFTSYLLLLSLAANLIRFV